ncbi:hypothetical protein LJC68_06090 [Bacteroidales bacterium OttesenSCG-928-B11]|nr:hypothetical protein [Bacteroidales bacterium OttesenSCG-928-B11]
MDKCRCFFLIFVILLFSVFFVSCPRIGNEVGTKSVRTVVRIDTVKIRDTVYHPVPYKVVETPIPAEIDTAKIIEDYFTEKHYSIAYSDSLIEGTTQIKLLENRVEVALLDYQILQKHTITNIEKVRDNRFGIHVGGSLNYHIPDKRFGLEVNASFQIKSHQILLGYDIVNQSPRLGWSYRIFKN